MDKMNEIFQHRQDELAWLANTEAGRFLLGVKEKNPIVGLAPNSYTQLMDIQKGAYIFKTTFHVRNDMAQTLIPELVKMDIYEKEYKRKLENRYKAFLHFSGLERQRNLPFILLTVSDFSPPNINTGFHCRDGASWASMRDISSATEALNNSTVYGVENEQTPGGLFYIARSFLSWATGTTLANAAISDATLSLYGAVVSNPRSDTVGIGAATPADPTSYVQGDFDQITLNGATEFCTRIAFASLSTSAYNVFTLNASGLAAINQTGGGYTVHSMRSRYDFDNTTPANGGGDSYFGWKHVSDADSAKRPKFSVTWTPATSIQKVRGVSYASIKKISGVAIASVKKVSGLE